MFTHLHDKADIQVQPNGDVAAVPRDFRAVDIHLDPVCPICRNDVDQPGLCTECQAVYGRVRR